MKLFGPNRVLSLISAQDESFLNVPVPQLGYASDDSDLLVQISCAFDLEHDLARIFWRFLI